MRIYRILLLFFGLFISVRSDEWSFDGSGEDDISFAKKTFPSDDEDMAEGSGGFGFDDRSKVDIDVIDKPEVNGQTGGSISDPTMEEDPAEEKAVDEETDDEVQEPQDSVKTGSLVTTTHFLAAVIVGGVIGLLFAVCVIMLLVYRMRKKDEGSYAIDFGGDSKKPHGNYEYTKGVDSKEYYA